MDLFIFLDKLTLLIFTNFEKILNFYNYLKLIIF
jgi:hypothetical protein